MYEVEKDGECITEHPGYAACCLNRWVLSTAAIGLKTKAKKSYSTTKTATNVAESVFSIVFLIFLNHFTDKHMSNII